MAQLLIRLTILLNAQDTRRIGLTERKVMARVNIDEFFCKGCGLCVDVCPCGILELNTNVITDKGYHPAHCIDEEKCTGCATCATMCPDVAITVWR